MDRNEIESDFRTSKIVTGSHLVKKVNKKKKICLDLKWPEMWSKVNFILSKIKLCIGCVSFWNDQKWDRKWFGHHKMATGSHFIKKNLTKIQIVILIWNGKKCDTKWFLDIQNGYPGGHLLKNIYKKSCASDLNNVRTDCWPTTTWYKFTFGQYIYMHTDSCVGNEGIYIVFAHLGRMHTILVDIVVAILNCDSCVHLYAAPS